ncbi:glycosyltransferase [Chloroflexota bacterium]
MQILVIADYLPYPLIGGDRIRIYNLLKRVASRHEVSLISFLEKPEDVEGVPHLKQFCARVETINFEQRSRLVKVPGLLGYALSGKPPELKLLHSLEFEQKLRELTKAIDFDIVQIEHARMALYLEALPQSNRRKSLLAFHNFTSQQYGRVSNVERNWGRKFRTRLNAVAMGYWEPRYAGRFDYCVTVSEEDRRLLLDANPRLHVGVIPNGVDVEMYQPLALQSGVTSPSFLFLGNMGYPPCVDAALYFCNDILPRIRKMDPAAEFWIVGRDPRPEVLALNNEHVHVTGRVVDVLPYYQQSPICVVPLRAGGGTRLKILEAMALGRPVISTSIGCEGLDVVHGEHLLIADTPVQFAEQSVRLLRDRALYQRLSTNGRKLVEARYSWDQIADKLINVYTEMLASVKFLGVEDINDVPS